MTRRAQGAAVLCAAAVVETLVSTGRASLTETDLAAATLALAAVRDHARAASAVGRK